MKECSNCYEKKRLIDFNKNRVAKDGRTSRCKRCLILAVRAHRVMRKVKDEISREKTKKLLNERRVILRRKNDEYEPNC